MAKKGVNAVERALVILTAFADGHQSLSLAELADRTGLYKSTILRICVSLERFGFVRRGMDGQFRLGPTLWQLGALYRLGFQLGDYIRPHLRRLADETGESASFFVREGEERVCLYRQNSRLPIRHHIDEGARFPLKFGATGRVLLAFGGEPGALYDRVRKAGYYVSLGERHEEIAAVAVPVFGLGGECLGALSVSGLRSHFTPAVIESARIHLRAAAGEIARGMNGYGQSPSYRIQAIEAVYSGLDREQL